MFPAVCAGCPRNIAGAVGACVALPATATGAVTPNAAQGLQMATSAARVTCCTAARMAVERRLSLVGPRAWNQPALLVCAVACHHPPEPTYATANTKKHGKQRAHAGGMTTARGWLGTTYLLKHIRDFIRIQINNLEPNHKVSYGLQRQRKTPMPEVRVARVPARRRRVRVLLEWLPCASAVRASDGCLLDHGVRRVLAGIQERGWQHSGNSAVQTPTVLLPSRHRKR